MSKARLQGVTRRFLAASSVLLALSLAACNTSSPSSDAASDAPATPVSYPVPEGCPTGEQFGQASVDDASWATAITASLIDQDVATPLPPGGCAYVLNKENATKSGERYRRVIVQYFNLDTPGHLTRTALQRWGSDAGGIPSDITEDGQPTGEKSTRSLDLPSTFTYFTNATVSWVDGATTQAFPGDHSVIPEFTQGASGSVEFFVGANRADALIQASKSGSAVADAMSGIIAVDVTVDAVTLTAINPTTGALTASRTFSADPARPQITPNNPYFAQRAFSPDLRRVAATKTIAADSSTHVGWITASGQFVDVTQAVAPTSTDFSETTKQSSPTFGADGTFYYLDGNTKQVKRITAEATTIDSLAKTTPETVASDVTDSFLVWPSGTIAPCIGSCVPLVEYKQPGPFGYGSRVSGWLDDNTLICSSVDLTDISLYAPYPAGSSNPANRGDWSCGVDSTEKNLLPKTDRQNWSPVGSPDGKSVAFISSPPSGDTSPSLFVVGRDGGDPTKVPTSKSFTRISAGAAIMSNELQLLAWR